MNLREIHRWPVDFPHKVSVMRKRFTSSLLYKQSVLISFHAPMPWRVNCILSTVRETRTSFNSLWPSNVIWRHRSGSTLVQTLAYRLCQSLSDQCLRIINWTLEQTLVKFASKHKIYESRKLIQKCPLQKGDHFVPASMCLISTWRTVISISGINDRHVMWGINIKIIHIGDSQDTGIRE